MTSTHELKIYRCEWVTQLYWVSDMGVMRDIIYESVWPSKEEAINDLQKIARPSPYITNKWIGKKDYQEAQVISRKTEIKPPFNKEQSVELLYWIFKHNGDVGK